MAGKRRQFFIIEAMWFFPQGLAIQVAALVPGEPGTTTMPKLIGQNITLGTLGVTEESDRYLVTFDSVGAFRVVSEAFRGDLGAHEDITDFLLKMTGESKYLAEFGDGAKFACRMPFEDPIFHFVVYSEFYVLDVLAPRAPNVEAPVPGSGKDGLGSRLRDWTKRIEH